MARPSGRRASAQIRIQLRRWRMVLFTPPLRMDYVYCFRQSNGEPVWKFKADGGLSRNFKERSGFWASPIVVKDRDLHWLKQRFHVLPDGGQR